MKFRLGQFELAKLQAKEGEEPKEVAIVNLQGILSMTQLDFLLSHRDDELMVNLEPGDAEPRKGEFGNDANDGIPEEL